MRSGDILAIHSLYDLSNTVNFLLRFIDELRHRNIGLYSISDKIDTDEMGSHFDIIVNSLSNICKKNIRERNILARDGRYLGNSTAGRPPTLSEEDIKEMINLYNKGNISVQKICNQKNVSRTTFYNYLKILDK